MKKRFLAAFMILVMGCALTACDEEEAADGQTAVLLRSRRGKLVDLLVSLWK